MADIYDGAFRTITNDCRELLIPLVNEAFGEQYTGKEKVEFHPNEHFIDQLEEPDQKRITDTNFTIIGDKKKHYHWECEGRPNGRILVRLFEYDAQIALDQGTVEEETLTVTFPHSAVLYLRSYHTTQDRMKYVIHTPGGTVSYDVPVLKVKSYTIEDIFEKKLLLLLPFYIFTYESRFSEYNECENKLKELKQVYRDILERLEDAQRKGEIGTFYKRTIIELSADVINELTKKYENVKKGVGEIMGGALLETEAVYHENNR